MIAFLILLPAMILTWLRVMRPGRHQMPGQVVYDAPLPLLARMRMHAAAGGLVTGLAVGMWLFWTLPIWGVLIALISLALLVAVPVRYTLTTIEIRAGWARPRRWTEFAGVSRAPGGARLQGAAGSRDMRIWLSGSRGDDEFVLLLRRMITGAYKGRNLLLEYPPRPGGSAPRQQSAAFEMQREALS